ncbi:MAG: RC-LH1 core complex protein PufX [Pseudomonadota bacterium]
MSPRDKSPFDGDGQFNENDVVVDVTKQLMVGAGLAAALILVPAAFIYVLYLVGTLLPPESKEAADPTPGSFSYLEYQQEHTMVVRVS